MLTLKKTSRALRVTSVTLMTAAGTFALMSLTASPAFAQVTSQTDLTAINTAVQNAISALGPNPSDTAMANAIASVEATMVSTYGTADGVQQVTESVMTAASNPPAGGQIVPGSDIGNGLAAYANAQYNSGNQTLAANVADAVGGTGSKDVNTAFDNTANTTLASDAEAAEPVAAGGSNPGTQQIYGGNGSGFVGGAGSGCTTSTCTH